MATNFNELISLAQVLQVEERRTLRATINSDTVVIADPCNLVQTNTSVFNTILVEAGVSDDHTFVSCALVSSQVVGTRNVYVVDVVVRRTV